MSGNSPASLSRRQLLKGGLALAAVPGRSGRARSWAEEPPTYPRPDRITRWALLSDTHIAADPENRYRGFYPYRNLQEVTAQIAYGPPDGVVITGDLARLKGETEAYENLKALLTPVARAVPDPPGLGQSRRSRRLLSDVRRRLRRRRDRGEQARHRGPGRPGPADRSRHPSEGQWAHRESSATRSVPGWRRPADVRRHGRRSCSSITRPTSSCWTRGGCSRSSSPWARSKPSYTAIPTSTSTPKSPAST